MSVNYFWMREAPVFVQDPSDGTYKVKNKHTGVLEPAWKHLHLEAGDEFANYVRRSGYCNAFPLDPNKKDQQCIEHPNLWPQRQLRILFFPSRDHDRSVSKQDKGVSEIWSSARVLTWTERSRILAQEEGHGGNRRTMEWTLCVEFESTGLDLQAGDVVKLQGLKNQKNLNGQCGVISNSSPNIKGRYSVVITDFEKKKVKAIAIKPGNLERLHFMEFIVHRIEIRSGGVLNVVQDAQSKFLAKFSPEIKLVTFQWVQDLVQTGPYWSKTSPGKKWLDPFSVDDGMDEFRNKYNSEMEACLRHDKEEEKTTSLVRVKEDLKSSLHILTRNGSPMGLREARLLLLTKPPVMALAAMKELVQEAAHNVHFLEVVAWMYKSEDIKPCETEALPEEQVEVGTKLGLDCDSGDKVRSLQLSLFVDVLKAFLGQKEYKTALFHAQSITGDGFFDKMINKPFAPGRGVGSIYCFNNINTAFGQAWRVVWTCAAAMGCAEQLVAVPIVGGTDFDPVLEYKQWFGTSKKPATEGVSWVEDKYDAEKMAWTGGERNCAVCRRACLVTYWCQKCKEVPYCSMVCSDTHWEQNGHWRECVPTDGEYVGTCAVCQKRSVVGCSYCKFTYYCGSVCQRKHWFEGDHKEKCPKTPMLGPEE